MSVAMPSSGQRVPEPDRANSQEVEASGLEQVQVLHGLSSDEESEENEEEISPDMNGYQPLAVAEQLNLSSDEEEEQTETSSSEQRRELNVDLDLVRHAMKNIKLSSSAIPPWAKEISESAWKEVVKQTVAPKDDKILSSSS